MNRRSRVLSLLVVSILWLAGCGTRAVSTQPQSDIKSATYEVLLRKPLTDEVVAGFITDHKCSNAMPYFLCKEVGMALLIDSSQIVEGVFLYLNKSAGSLPYKEDFTPYHGELPFGLKFYDTKAGVEYKLRRQGIGKEGLPDLDGTPDHMHYTATYQEVGLTIIYNSPIDDDALINAILVTQS